MKKIYPKIHPNVHFSCFMPVSAVKIGFCLSISTFDLFGDFCGKVQNSALSLKYKAAISQERYPKNHCEFLEKTHHLPEENKSLHSLLL